MATVPTAPTEAAGTISASADWNNWGNAVKFFLGGGSSSNPMFYLTAAAAQTWTTSFQAATFSNAGPIFKDNDSGFSSSSPSQYTVQTPGYWSVDWFVNGGTSASYFAGYLLITTTASNLYNPSTTLKCQYTNTTATTTPVFISSGGLVPIYLFAGDTLQVEAVAGGASSSAHTSPITSFSGQWVSA